MLIALKSAILGIIQGLTEFIPVSSSGHLVLVSRMFGWQDKWLPGMSTHGTINTAALAFTVALHIGTLIALLVYFNKEWLVLIKSFFTGFASKPGKWSTDQRLAWFLVLATIPAGVVGALWGDSIEGHLSTPFWIAVCLIAVSFVMLAAQMLGSRARGIELLKGKDAASAGFAQIIALAPGVSRSGITMSGGLFTGLDFEAAARFAFLLAAPIMAGTGILEGAKLVKQGLPPHFVQIFLPGFVLAAVVGLLAIKFMLGYLKKGTLMPFIIYRFGVAAIVLIVLAVTRW
jgi:undecaprenyl-diphosphatase